MSPKNANLLNVQNGDKTTGFKYPTAPAKEAIKRDQEFGPRSALVPDGNYILTCRTAAYITGRKTDGVFTPFKAPMIEATWEAFAPDGTSLGTFRDNHSLPIQKKEGDDISGSEKFWSIMGRSFAEYAGELEAFLKAEEPLRTPASMEGKSGYARLRVQAAKNGSGKQYTNVWYFMGKEEYERNPGPATGVPSVPARIEEPPEVAGEPIDDDDVPF